MIEELNDDKFNLERNSFLTIGSVFEQTFSLIPPDKNEKIQVEKSVFPITNEQLFIGDSRGILYLVGYTPKGPHVRVKTLPFKSEITCIDIHTTPTEQIYYSYGNSIYMTNRYCTQNSKIEFDIPDKISKFRIRDNLVFTVSNSFVNCYEYGKYTQEICTNDVENTITGFHISDVYGKQNPLILAGCSNKLRFYKTDKMIHSLPMSSAPTAFLTHKFTNYDQKEGNILFGTTFGSNGLLVADETKEIKDKDTKDKESADNPFKILWERNSDKVLSGVVAMRNFDINNDSNKEIILIREGGELDVYTLGNTLLDHFQISHLKTGEILTGMEVGNFMSQYDTEIMLSTLTGLIFSLTPNGNKDQTTTKKTMDKNQVMQTIKDLQMEINALQGYLKEKREESESIQYANIMQSEKNDEKKKELIVRRNPYKTNYKFILLPEESLYDLSIESEFPLEVIVMQADVKVDIVDVVSADLNINVIKNSEKEFLCTIRLRGNSHSANIKIRSQDGNKSILKCTLVPMNVPKTSYILEIPIKALPLYQRITDDGDIYEQGCIRDFKEIDEKYMNKITIEGNFSCNEINQILSELMPDIPERTTKDRIRYYMKDSFLNTILCIDIENEHCILRSVNFTPLMIIKEQIAIIANVRRKNITNQVRLELASIFKVLNELNPLIQHNFQLESHHKILEAFKEIDMEQISKLPKKYEEILHNKEIIEKQYKTRGVNLDFMKNIVLSLLKNLSKVTQVVNFKAKIEEVEEILKNYSVEKIVTAFKNFTSK